MMIVPGASRPSNWTTSRGIGEATGCNWESRRLANAGPAPALKKKLANAAAQTKIRRMDFPLNILPEARHERCAKPFPARRNASGQIMAERRRFAILPPLLRQWNQPLGLNCRRWNYKNTLFGAARTERGAWTVDSVGARHRRRPSPSKT